MLGIEQVIPSIRRNRRRNSRKTGPACSQPGIAHAPRKFLVKHPICRVWRIELLNCNIVWNGYFESRTEFWNVFRIQLEVDQPLQ